MKSETQNKASKLADTNKGFTIVETLVAITILMIAVAGPLTIANQALHSAQDARNQLIATNLAQETIEEVRNYKDNFIRNGTLCNLFQNYIGQPSQCTGQGPRSLVKKSPFGSYVIETCTQEGFQNCALYLSSATGYMYTSAADTNFTPFARWFTLTPISSTEFLLAANVTWTSGGAQNQVQIQDLLSATPR